jgi:hypothetical protein
MNERVKLGEYDRSIKGPQSCSMFATFALSEGNQILGSQYAEGAQPRRRSSVLLENHTVALQVITI